MGKPDIIFFMVDQLAARWLEVGQSGVFPTPNIDRLRSMGTTFSNVIASNPVCCPSRATLATGLSTRGHGLLENGYRLDPTLPTFMRSLQEAGWRTGAFGKIHYLPQFETLTPDYRPYGFDIVHNTEDDRGGEWLDWALDTYPEHTDAILATVWCSYIPGYTKYGPDKRNLRQRIEAVRDGFQWATPQYPLADAHCYPLPFPEEVSQTNWITDRTADFIRQASPNQPLYAHISYVQPHRPLCAPADDLARIQVDEIPEPLTAEWLDDAHGPLELKRRAPIAPQDWRFRRQMYFADIVHLDRQLGRVLDTLEAANRLENTYLFFLSDHGELLYDHGLTDKGEKHYDGAIRVPLIIAGPGLQQNGRCSELVQLEDIYPTVLEMAGAAYPQVPVMGPYLEEKAEDIAQLPGRSLAPFCRGEVPATWRDAAYCESYNNIRWTNPGQWARTVRTHKYRYTAYPKEHGEQLFDLESDPGEQRNLIGSQQHVAIRQEMRDRLFELLILQDYPKTRRGLFSLGVH